MTPILANIFGFGNPVEIAIIAGVVVLLFGGAKIAGFGKNLGEGMKEFKKAVKETQEDEPAQPTAPPPPPPTNQNVAEKPEPVGAAAKSTSEETNKEP